MSLPAPTTWNEAAQQAAEEIFAQKRRKKRATIEQVRTDLDEFIETLFHSPAGYVTAKGRWAVVGGDAVELGETLECDWLSPKTVTTLLIKKQQDYGKENIGRFGRQGLLVRVNDKVARLENLLATGKQPTNESIQDTVLDIVGYSIIGIVWESQQFYLPLA